MFFARALNWRHWKNCWIFNFGDRTMCAIPACLAMNCDIIRNRGEFNGAQNKSAIE